jgi:hypothetical protein
MALEITRVCDKCGSKHELSLGPTRIFPNGDVVVNRHFKCSDCLLLEVRKIQAEQNMVEPIHIYQK